MSHNYERNTTVLANSVDSNNNQKPLVDNLKLWNPNVAANLSILFTPIFGAWIHSQNWNALKRPDHAKKSMLWVYGGIALVFIFCILPTLPSILGLVYLFIWYFVSAKTQIKYIMENNIDYQRKRWWKSIRIPLGAYGVLLGLFFFYYEVNSSKDTTSHLQESTSHSKDPASNNSPMDSTESNGLQEIAATSMEDAIAQFKPEYSWKELLLINDLNSINGKILYLEGLNVLQSLSAGTAIFKIQDILLCANVTNKKFSSYGFIERMSYKILARSNGVIYYDTANGGKQQALSISVLYIDTY